VSRLRLAVSLAAVAVRVFLADEASADQPTKQECVIANETAQDLQRAGKLIEAREQLTTCASSACPGAVRTDCADRLKAVGAAMPTLLLSLKDAGGGDASAASLSIDGVPQTAELDGKPVAVDPGAHTFTMTLAGRAPVSFRLTLGDGDHVRRDVVFKPAPAPAPASGELPAQGSETVSAPAAPSPGGSNVITMRRIGWAAMGAGATGLALGTIFGLVAVSKHSSLGDECNGRACPPTASAESDIEALHANGVASDIGFTVGILGVGTGAALLFLFPESATEAPRSAASGLVVRPWAGLGDVGVRGSFR
jgi:hypothetical protein